MDTLTEITKNKLLVVEGKDEKEFLNYYLRYLGKDDEFDIAAAGGVRQFHNKFPVLVKMRGFDRVQAIGFIRDAEEDCQGAFQSICGVIARENLEPPEAIGSVESNGVNIGVFVSPDNRNKGCFEDLCLATVINHPAIACVNDFIECISENLEELPNNMSKTKALAYLSAMPEDVIRVGHGASRGYWDFDSPALDQLKEFLERLR